MAKNTNVETLCNRELLEKILSIVERQEKLPPPAHEGGHRLYDNKSLMEKLNIKEKYLKSCETTVISATRVKVINTGTRRKTWTAFCIVSIMKLSLLAMNFQNRKEVAMFDTIHLTNMLRSEVEGIPETGLPLDAFPDKIQEIILNLSRYENFNVEYTASIVLSAVATAIGNSCHIRIKGEWKTCPSLYMMLVDVPGLERLLPSVLSISRLMSMMTGSMRNITRNMTNMKEPCQQASTEVTGKNNCSRNRIL